MARKLASALMVALMGAPPSITALGLGELDSDSALNEPLTARIPLLSMHDADAEAVRVSLASQAAFEEAGLDRPFYLSQLKFEVKQADGEHFILISTEKPIKEPFLDFLLQVRWPEGELQREYAVLLDPPQYGTAQPSGAAQEGHALATQAKAQKSAATPPYSSSNAAVAESSMSRPSGSTRYGPVQATQTLWSIATDVRPPHGVTVYQTMQAIVRANPEAFIGGDVNAMMKGAMLRIPAREEIARIDAQQAARHVQQQLARWRENHTPDGSEASPAATGALAAEGGKDSEAGSGPSAAMPRSTGRLHVVAARDDAETQATESLADQALAPTQQNILKLQREVALGQERNANLTSAKERLQQQTSSLKEELANLRSIVNLQLDEGGSWTAALVLSDQQGASNSAPQAATAESAPQNDAAQQGAAPVGEIHKPQAEASAGSSQLPADIAAKPSAKPSLKSRLLGYLPQGAMSLGLLIGAGLLILALLWAVRRRRVTARSHKGSEDTSGSAVGQAVASGEPTPILGHATVQSALGSTVGESNPIDEAEAYIARGRYDQAQELLDHALGEHPDNRELRVKLLEVLAAQGDRSGFEAEAQVLHTQVTDESDSYWQRTIELAHEIAPDHPLFSNAITPDTETTTAQSEQGGNVTAAGESMETPQAKEADFELTVSELALDQSETEDEEEPPPMNGRGESAALEFDLGEIEAFTSQRSRTNEVSPSPSSSSGDAVDAGDDDWGSLDFSLPEDSATSDRAVENTAGDEGDDDQDTLQLGRFTLENGADTEDTSAAESDDSMSLDEAGTKLDLARAYLDMGDTSGARSLLNEVITEGDAAQQDEAQELLRQVG